MSLGEWMAHTGSEPRTPNDTDLSNMPLAAVFLGLAFSGSRWCQAPAVVPCAAPRVAPARPPLPEASA